MPVSVDCPACGDALEVADEHRGWTVRCPSCRHEFVAAAGEPPPRRAGRRRSRYADDDEYDDGDLIADARAAVAGPANWLRMYGLLQAVGGVLGLLLTGAMVAMVNNQPPGRRGGGRQDELIVNLVILGFNSVCAIAGGALTARGATKMARVEGHGWGVASAVMAIGSVLYCTCGLFVGLPIGIWALVVLNKRDVSDGFEAAARRRAGRYLGDDEDDDD